MASHPLLLEMINQISLSQSQLLSRVSSISAVSATVMSFLDPAEVAAMLRIQREDQWMDTLKVRVRLKNICWIFLLSDNLLYDLAVNICWK